MASSGKPSHTAQIAESFFASLGLCVSDWAFIDQALFDFCQIALGTDDRKTAIVFYRVPNIGDHFNLTSALMGATLTDPAHIALWGWIKQEIERLLPLRNEIAHNPAYEDVRLTDSLDIEFSWFVETEPRKLLRSKKPGQRYTHNELKAHIRDLRALMVKTHELRRALRSTHSAPP